MEKREEALREGLTTNAEETDRWNAYKTEIETAITNLDMFCKHLSVDVMVPIGSKAFMPGQLIHTNEVLVGHYQGYFSKCSAHKATEICELRLQKAAEQLRKLKEEEDLYQNKLNEPYKAGAMPTGLEQEIIEDYDEEMEKKWREEHAKRVKKAKLQEKRSRDGLLTEKERQEDEEILKMLEDAELMEELEQELETLEISDAMCEDTLKKLMSGELPMPSSKPRIAHDKAKEQKPEEKPVEPMPGVVKKSELSDSPRTNNNTTPNPDITIDNPRHYDEEEDEDIPAEILIIREQAKFLPAADRIGFLEYQIQIITEKMRTYTKESEFSEKLRALSIKEYLEDLLDEAEREIGDLELAECEANEAEQEIENKENISDNTPAVKSAIPQEKPKRRISFALENQTLEFRKNETVSQMLPKVDDPIIKVPPKRDIITLDEPLKCFKPPNQQPITPKSKQQACLERVQKNLEFVRQSQSIDSSNVVDNIINGTQGIWNTLHIPFKHSSKTVTAVSAEHDGKRSETAESIPHTPADFYNIYLKCRDGIDPVDVKQETAIYLDGYIGEEHVKVPLLREVYHEQAYEDPKAKFSVPMQHSSTKAEEILKDVFESAEQTPKPILRNKAAVAQEQHIIPIAKTKKKKKPVRPVDENEYMSAYDKVISDVVEKPLTEPDPLPKGPYIDAHTPKKRISRFKQMRTEMEYS